MTSRFSVYIHFQNQTISYHRSRTRVILVSIYIERIVSFEIYSSTMWDEISFYHIQGSQVFYGNQYIPAARWSDFQDLGYGYGL